MLEVHLQRASSKFSQSLLELVSCLNSPATRVVDPRPFLAKLFGSSTVFGQQQQDAHEFLVVLLGQIRPASQDRIDAVLDFNRLSPFQGILSERIICKSCRSVTSQKLSPFSVLSLDPAASVSAAIYSLSAKLEPLDGYKCRCGVSYQCFRSSEILRWPNILMLHINRIRIESNGRPLKDNSPVRVDDVLENNGKKFRLCSYCVHGGEINSGHYVAFRRSSPTTFQFISDSDSQRVSINDISDQPYLLLYEMY
jgi:ubiquitin C-terminal hydrolase